MTEPKSTQCILCGNALQPGVTKCPKCGTEMRDIASKMPQTEVAERSLSRDLLRKEIPKVELPEMKRTCPFCALPIDESQAKCPRCGIPLKSEEEMLECPDCGTLSPVNSKSCPNCGVSFEEEPEVPTPVPSGETLVVSVPAEAMPTSVEPAPEAITTVSSKEIRAAGEGLVNGRGAVNGTGLVNGRGAINGTGLVNGTGMTNGTSVNGRLSTGSRRGAAVLRRWQFMAVLLALAVIIPTFMFLSYSNKSGTAIDGSFGEWAHVEKFDMQPSSNPPELSVQEWAVQSNAKLLYMYLKAEGNLMSSSDVSSFYLFVDSDNNPGTGYSVSGMGADYLLEMHGWDGEIKSSSASRYGSSNDQYNWSGWINIESLSSAVRSERLEAMAELPIVLGQDARFLLLSQNNLPNQVSSVSYPVPAKGGALVIRQEPGTGIIPGAGTIPAAASVSLLKLVLSCEGRAGTVNSITPAVTGAALVSPITAISLSPGEQKTVDVLVDSSSALSEYMVSAIVAEEGVDSTFSDVVIFGEQARAYVASPPASIQIDGAFGDWIGRISPDNDSLPVANPNINITAAGFANTTSNAAFYVGVQGQICQGAYVPAIRGKPSTMGSGGGVVIPARKTGEDMLRIYIDSDMTNSTGQLVTMTGKVIGADYMIEIVGMNGQIVSKSLMQYIGTRWIPNSSNIAAANDAHQIELSMPSASIGGSSSIGSIIETTDWRARSDWAWTGSALDPWVIDANGTTYMSSDGSTWSYLGSPQLEIGDRIVDIAMTQDGADAFLVTNTGRTYYWTLGTSTNWTAGETTPIDIVTYSEAVSMAFYSSNGASAWLLTKNGSYFWLQNAHKSTKDWTYQNTPLVGYTDYTDLFYAGGTMYALRSGQNTSLNYSGNGNSFTAVTSPTGSTSNQTQFIFIPLTSGSSDDLLFVLCENGNIRNSSDGGQTWSALGDLPAPTGGNTTKYVALGIDPAGYMWVVTSTGYTYKSTDITTYKNFTCTGQSPIGNIIAILPTTVVIPEFITLMVPVFATVFFFVMIPRIRRKQR